MSIENVNREAKSISNGKVVDATLMTIDILKWTRPETSQWITTTMDQAIKQGFPKDWLMNLIKETNK